MAQDSKAQESTPKKGWFKGLQNLIFEEVPETNAEKQVSDETTSKSTASSTPNKFTYSEVAQSNNQNIPSSMVIPNSNGMFDEKFYNNFLQVIEMNNIEGIDYFEFSKALKALASTGMAEPMKYQSAFSTLKATSTPVLTKDTLLKTADFYIEKLEQEKAEFNAEMKNELESQVTSRLNQAKSKQEEIVRKQEEINKLQSEMGTLHAEIGTLNVEAQQAESKITATGKNFDVSLEVLKNQINSDKQNISNYIQ